MSAKYTMIIQCQQSLKKHFFRQDNQTNQEYTESFLNFLNQAEAEFSQVIWKTPNYLINSNSLGETSTYTTSTYCSFFAACRYILPRYSR